MLLNYINEVINFDRKVIRNTPILISSVDEFDDLVDDSFDRGFAHRFTRRTNDISANVMQDHAINYVFTQNQLPPSRFSDGSFPAWYASLDPTTTFHETCYHWLNDFLQDMYFVSKKKIFQERSIFNVDCNAFLIDLRKKTSNIPELISKKSSAYETTQSLGKILHQQGNPGIYTLSARHKSGENIVVYNSQIVTNADLINNVLYEFDPTNSKITVKDFETDKILAKI